MVAILPAHNEELALPSAVHALQAQTCLLNRIIVAADNSTDKTVAVARSLGVEVRETVDNTEKKAGALNQILDDLLPTLKDEDIILAQDADSRLALGAGGGPALLPDIQFPIDLVVDYVRVWP